MEERKHTATLNEKETETETAIISDTPVQIPTMDESSCFAVLSLAFCVSLFLSFFFLFFFLFLVDFVLQATGQDGRAPQPVVTLDLGYREQPIARANYTIPNNYLYLVYSIFESF